MQKDKITIYTDGAARGNPGKAGWGAILLSGKDVFEIGGRSDHATNNQMELTAAIEAMKFLDKNKISASVEIFSDSKYVIFGATEWIHGWMKNNWRNAAKKPVLNKELWKEIYLLTQKLNPKWKYVAGHNGDKWNERADEIATNFADNNKIELRKSHIHMAHAE